MSHQKRLNALCAARRALLDARVWLAAANAPHTSKRLRATMRSLDGAIRNRSRFASKAEREVEAQ